MNYEEKYKQALEKAVSIYNNKNASDARIAILEEIFPELKESEDERIRKELIDYFKENNAALAFRGISNESVIAWLEKQKERSPLSKDEEYTLARIIEYLEDNDCPSKWKDLLHDIYALPYQKEQKPWSEEDELMLMSIIQTLKLTNGAAQMKIDWLKSIKERVQPQNRWKPSDEQMEALNFVINLMAPSKSPKENDYYYNVFKGLREQLKKLREE